MQPAVLSVPGCSCLVDCLRGRRGCPNPITSPSSIQLNTRHKCSSTWHQCRIDALHSPKTLSTATCRATNNHPSRCTRPSVLSTPIAQQHSTPFCAHHQGSKHQLVGKESRPGFLTVCQAAAASSGGSSQAQPATQLNPKLLAGVLLVLFLGVANRVLYKMALSPMHNHTFFLAQLQNAGYLAVYFTTLWLRYRAGRVTHPMLAIDKRPLWAIGACEAVAQLLFMISASHLPGALLPIINQSFLLWSLIWATFILHTRFSRTQLMGAFLIMLGVIFAAAPPSLWQLLLGEAAGAGWQYSTAQVVQPVYVMLGVLCFAFPALASIIKDMIFRKERERLGQPLDIFMVNSFGSLYQAVFVLLLLPITSALYGVRLPDLPTYLSQGAQCFMGLQPACGGDCTGAPLLPCLYVAANLAFNIAMLTLLRTVGTVTTTIVGSCLVPLTILAFTMPLPLLPPSSMGPGFIAGAALLCCGLLVYNWQVLGLGHLFRGLASSSDSVDLPQP